MSDLPIPTQPNQPKKSPMTDIFSSLISGGCHVVAQVATSYINQETQLKVADKNQETQLKLEQLRNEL
ncbi:MAG: hypothetical protein ACKPE1_20980, partial [Dolichospermum sp.]